MASDESRRAEICCLGPLLIRTGGRGVSVRPAERRFLAALVAASPRAVSSDEIAEVLWPLGPPATARSVIQVHVSRVRRNCGPVIETADDGYRLALGGIELSSTTFERGVLEIEALGEVRPDHAIERARLLLALWRGTPLPELEDHHDGQVAAARLVRLRRQLIDVASTIMLRTGRSDEAVLTLESAVAEAPLHEPFWHSLMRAHYQCGDHVNAVRSYGRYRRLLAEEMGLEPGPAITELEHRILLHDPSLLGESPATTNVPITGCSIIGRSTHISAVESALADHRLVSIVGPAGVGKTRLAVEIADRAVGRGDTVRYVGLAGLADDRHIVEELWARLGGDRPSSSSAAWLTELANRPVLLVIDGVDERADGVRRLLASLLGPGTACRTLVTSRSPLGAVGERRITLGALPTPPIGASLDHIVMSPAVQLLLEQVRMAVPAFRLTADNAELVAATVRQADGLPLALELAAAWVPVIGIAGVARDRPARQSLEEVLGQSLAALDHHERRVIDIASTVSRWFDVALLHRLLGVPAAPDVDHDPMAAAVRSLVDRALLESEHLADGRVRHRLLAPVKELVRSRVVADETTVALQRLHRRWVLDHARSVRAAIGTEDEHAHFLELDELFEDYRTAIASGMAAGDTTTVVEIAGSIWRYWFSRFREQEGIDVLEAAMNGAPAARCRPWGLRTLGWLHYMAGHHEQALAELDRAAKAAERRGDHAVLAVIRLDQAQSATGSGRPHDAVAHLADAQVHHGKSPSAWVEAVLQCRLGAALIEQGDTAGAAHQLDIAITALAGVGDRRELGLALALRSHVYRHQGEGERAIAAAADSAANARRIRDIPLSCTAAIAMAPAAAAVGDLPAAARCVAEVAAVLPRASRVNVCQLVLAGAALAVAANEVALAEHWVGCCRTVYTEAGLVRPPQLQRDLFDRFPDLPRHPAALGVVERQVADFAARVLADVQPTFSAGS